MDVQLSSEVRENPNLSALATWATDVLRSEMGPAAATVRAKWGLDLDHVNLRPQLKLSVSGTGDCDATFLVPDFSDSQSWLARLRQWCGDWMARHRCG